MFCLRKAYKGNGAIKDKKEPKGEILQKIPVLKI